MLAASLIHYQEPRVLSSASFNSEADDFSVATREATKLSKKRWRRHRRRLASSQIHYNSSRSLGSSSVSTIGTDDDDDDSSVASCDKTVQISNVNDSVVDAYWLLTVFGCNSAPR